MFRMFGHFAGANPAVTDCMFAFQLTGSLFSALAALAGSALLRSSLLPHHQPDQGVTQ